MRHEPDAVSRFLSGETRLIFARRVTDGALVELPQGQAEQWRAVTRRELRCPLPECSAPDLVVVARAPQRRDGFSHRGGYGGHAPESLFHLQGKARVAAWLRERHPELTVTVEGASGPDRERIADVLAESSSGSRWAFEIQYAALTPAEWLRRSASYRAQGIVDVWLFGHLGAQMIARSGGRVLLSSTQVAMRDAGRRVMWLNPITGDIATAAGVATVDAQRFDVPAAVSGELVLAPLDSLELTTRGLNGELFARLDRGLSDFEAAAAARGVRETGGARVSSAALHEIAVAEAAARAELAASQRREKVVRRARVAGQMGTWRSTPAYRELLARFPDGVPWWVSRRDRESTGALSEQWHAIVFLRWIDRLRPGAVVSVADAVSAFEQLVVDSPSTSRTAGVRDWLVALSDAGWLGLRGVRGGVLRFEVLGEPELAWSPPLAAGEAGRVIPASVCASCGTALVRLQAHAGAGQCPGCAARTARQQRRRSARVGGRP